MRKTLLLLLVSIVTIILLWGTVKNKSKDGSQPVPTVGVHHDAPLQQSPIVKKSSAIFIPYWTDWKKPVSVFDYDRVIYFGIVPTIEGINKLEAGYQHLEQFRSAVLSSQKKLLTVRMVNSDLANTILKNKDSWQKIEQDTLDIAKNYQFSGVLLDLEVSNLPLTDVADTITSFVQDFSTHTRGQNLSFAVAVYGDTFYRRRPYDIATISQSVDEIMVMAYDLHKAGGEPGPNFPLRGQEKYSYDIESLVQDFGMVPKEKLSFIFGMYGYDWAVDETKKPIRPAKAFSDLDIKKSFIDSCQWKNCLVLHDEISAETEVDYIDENLLYHIVWFEDKDSVEKKKKFLEEKGIGSVAYWTYGYF